MTNSTIVKIKSNRLGEEFSVEAYQKDDVLIIRHTSLENIFWGMPDEQRPEMTVDTVDLGRMPGIPPMFAVRCVLKDPVSGSRFEQFGEMLCSNWQVASKITRDFPLTMCKNQAFDRAFVRFLQFDISGKAIALYSDSEIDIPYGIQPCTNEAQEAEAAEPAPGEAAEPVMEAAPEPVQNTQAGQIPDSIDMDFGVAEQSIPVAAETTAVSGETGDPQTDIWAGMGADDTLSAYGYDQTEIPDCTEIPDVFGAGAPSPFPWNQNRTPNTEPPVENVSVPETQTGSPLTVYEVGFDLSHGNGKSVIKTSAGTVFFDPFNMVWETNEVDLSTINLDELYQKASSFIGYDLKEYNGLTLP